MPWAIFSREFNWSRPKSPLSFNVQPSLEPQERPGDVIKAAVEAGAAERAPTPKRQEKRADSGRKPAQQRA